MAFVTSANFTQAAQARNIEVGALIRSPRFAASLAEHFEALAEAGELEPVSGLSPISHLQGERDGQTATN